MSYTHGTTHYNLPLTVGTDTRDWSDTNEAFAAVDAALYQTSQNAETAMLKTDELDAQINTPNTGIAAELSGAKSDIISLAGRLTTAEGTIVQHHQDIADVRKDLEDMTSAYNEPTATSTHAYGVGDYFIYNDILYRATEMIAIGDTIVPNSNCEATNVMVEIDDLNQRVGNVDISDVGSSCTNAIRSLALKKNVEHSMSGVIMPGYVTASGNYCDFFIPVSIPTNVQTANIDVTNVVSQIVIHKPDGTTFTATDFDINSTAVRRTITGVNVELKFNSTQSNHPCVTASSDGKLILR